MHGGHLRGVGVGNIHVGGTRTLHGGGTYGVSGRGLCTGWGTNCGGWGWVIFMDFTGC